MQSEAEYSAGYGRKISEFNRGYMNAVHDYGASADYIANLFNIARCTVYRLTNRT
jgi:hypothetical protein